jgi:hypothetical protein
MKFKVFWDAALYNQVDVDRRFRDAYWLHHQADKWAVSERIAGYIGVQVNMGWPIITCYPFEHGSLIVLMMEAVRTYETSMNINLTTWRYIAEDSKLQLLTRPPKFSGSPASSDIGEVRRYRRRSENFAYQYPKYLKGSFTRLKILRHGTSGFTFRSMEGELRIFIAIKNPSPRPGFNPRYLSPAASTLITTLPRRLTYVVVKYS